VAERAGLLNRYTPLKRVEGSNPSLSAVELEFVFGCDGCVRLSWSLSVVDV
jgi:hypothetical protein